MYKMSKCQTVTVNNPRFIDKHYLCDGYWALRSSQCSITISKNKQQVKPGLNLTFQKEYKWSVIYTFTHILHFIRCLSLTILVLQFLEFVHTISTNIKPDKVGVETLKHGSKTSEGKNWIKLSYFAKI